MHTGYEVSHLMIWWRQRMKITKKKKNMICTWLWELEIVMESWNFMKKHNMVKVSNGNLGRKFEALKGTVKDATERKVIGEGGWSEKIEWLKNKDRKDVMFFGEKEKRVRIGKMLCLGKN